MPIYRSYYVSFFVYCATVGVCACQKMVPAQPGGNEALRFSPFECPLLSTLSDEDEASNQLRDALFYGDHISPGVKVDYLSIRNTGLRWPVVEKGIKCSTARDAVACEQNLETIIQSTQTSDMHRSHTPVAITTNGDEVRLWKAADFITLLGKIDTPTEAWIMMRGNRVLGMYTCEPYVHQESGGNATDVYRKVSAGYELKEQHYTKTCRPIEVTEQTHLVEENGSVHVLEERVVYSETEGCVAD